MFDRKCYICWPINKVSSIITNSFLNMLQRLPLFKTSWEKSRSLGSLALKKQVSWAQIFPSGFLAWKFTFRFLTGFSLQFCKRWDRWDRWGWGLRCWAKLSCCCFIDQWANSVEWKNQSDSENLSNLSNTVSWREIINKVLWAILRRSRVILSMSLRRSVIWKFPKKSAKFIVQKVNKTQLTILEISESRKIPSNQWKKRRKRVAKDSFDVKFKTSCPKSKFWQVLLYILIHCFCSTYSTSKYQFRIFCSFCKGWKINKLILWIDRKIANEPSIFSSASLRGSQQASSKRSWSRSLLKLKSKILMHQLRLRCLFFTHFDGWSYGVMSLVFAQNL